MVSHRPLNGKKATSVPNGQSIYLVLVTFKYGKKMGSPKKRERSMSYDVMVIGRIEAVLAFYR
jgi:hypothetical protein